MSIYDFGRRAALEKRIFDSLDRHLTDSFFPLFGGVTSSARTPEEPKTLTIDILDQMTRLLNTPPGERMAQPECGTPVSEFVKSAERYADNVFAPKDLVTRSIFGIDFVTSPFIEPEHIGHWLPPEAIKPSKNRSKRVWKKLLHGTRKRRKVAQRMTQDVAYLMPGPYGKVLAMPPGMEEQIIKMTV